VEIALYGADAPEERVCFGLDLAAGPPRITRAPTNRDSR